METSRPSVPKGLPISVVIMLILGVAYRPVLRLFMTPEEIQEQIFLNAVPFLLIFIAIVMAFITLTWLIASMLNNNIPLRIHRPIEWITIAGIVLGVIGMFQPWWFLAYRYGFMLLLISTLAFILWSHIVPKGVHRQTQLGSMSVSEFEQRETE